MAEWPDIYEVFQIVDLEAQSQEDWEDIVDSARLSAIDQVKLDVGNWTDDDEPTDRLAHAALVMAALILDRPEGSPDLTELSRDPTYRSLLKGRRRRFGIASWDAERAAEVASS